MSNTKNGTPLMPICARLQLVLPHLLGVGVTVDDLADGGGV